jgi:hypothetical protein
VEEYVLKDMSKKFAAILINKQDYTPSFKLLRAEDINKAKKSLETEYRGRDDLHLMVLTPREAIQLKRIMMNIDGTPKQLF